MLFAASGFREYDSKGTSSQVLPASESQSRTRPFRVDTITSNRLTKSPQPIKGMTGAIETAQKKSSVSSVLEAERESQRRSTWCRKWKSASLVAEERLIRPEPTLSHRLTTNGTTETPWQTDDRWRETERQRAKDSRHGMLVRLVSLARWASDTIRLGVRVRAVSEILCLLRPSQ